MNIFPTLYIEIAISILALGGFSLAAYIHSHKKTHKKLVCPLRGSCETVIHSNYSRFFGVPVEMLGMLYYILIAIVHISFIFIPTLTNPSLLITSLIFSMGAFLFSLYLLSVQFFIIRKWCTWCLFSALISTIIFLLTIGSAHSIFGF